jgi:hypothetical protein
MGSGAAGFADSYRAPQEGLQCSTVSDRLFYSLLGYVVCWSGHWLTFHEHKAFIKVFKTGWLPTECNKAVTADRVRVVGG